jgi:putative oxidoreductase
MNSTPSSVISRPTAGASMDLAFVSPPLTLLARVLNALQSPFALLTRLYVSWQFLKSGWLKVSSWDQTLDLFRTEYHVPLLPPTLAAYVGSFGELFFPVLLILGIGGRIGPLGLFAVNLMAAVSYWQELVEAGAIGQHYLWGFMLLMLAIYGMGAITLDRLLSRVLGNTSKW